MSNPTAFQTSRLQFRPLTDTEVMEKSSLIPPRETAQTVDASHDPWYQVWEITDRYSTVARPIYAYFNGPPQGGVTELDISVDYGQTAAERAVEAAVTLSRRALRRPGTNLIRVYPSQCEEAFLSAASAAGLTTASNGMALCEKGATPWTYVSMCVGIVVGAIVGFTWKGKLWAIIIGFLLFGLIGSLIDMKIRLGWHKKTRDSRPIRRKDHLSLSEDEKADDMAVDEDTDDGSAEEVPPEE